MSILTDGLEYIDWLMVFASKPQKVSFVVIVYVDLNMCIWHRMCLT